MTPAINPARRASEGRGLQQIAGIGPSKSVELNQPDRSRPVTDIVRPAVALAGASGWLEIVRQSVRVWDHLN